MKICDMTTEQILEIIYDRGFNDALMEFMNYVDGVEIIDQEGDAYDIGFAQAVKTIKEGLQKIMLDAKRPR